MNFVVFFQHNTHACHDLEANPPEIRGFAVFKIWGILRDKATASDNPGLGAGVKLSSTGQADRCRGSRTEHNSRNYKMQAMRYNSNICL